MADNKEEASAAVPTHATVIAVRDPLGRYMPGTSGNPAGRPVILAEVRAAARRQSLASIAVLACIRDCPEAAFQTRAAAADRLLQWAFGGPAAVAGRAAGNYASMSDAELDAAVLAEEGGEVSAGGPIDVGMAAVFARDNDPAAARVDGEIRECLRKLGLGADRLVDHEPDPPLSLMQQLEREAAGDA